MCLIIHRCKVTELQIVFINFMMQGYAVLPFLLLRLFHACSHDISVSMRRTDIVWECLAHPLLG